MILRKNRGLWTVYLSLHYIFKWSEEEVALSGMMSYMIQNGYLWCPIFTIFWENFNRIRWILKAQTTLVTKYIVLILFMIRKNFPFLRSLLSSHSLFTQCFSPRGAMLCDKTKNGCIGDYFLSDFVFNESVFLLVTEWLSFHNCLGLLSFFNSTVMAFVTYILVAGLVMGTQNRYENSPIMLV